MKNYETDILIVGAGLTGLCISNILLNLGYKIILIDKNKINSNYFDSSDFRTTAISEGSKNILEKSNLWNQIKPHSQLIERIKIFDRISSNKIDFSNPQKNQNLGYIVENKILKKIFFENIKKSKQISIFDSFDINNLEYNESSISANSKDRLIKSKLLIAADGKFSSIRKLSKITIYEKKYNHNAMVLNLSHSKNHNNTAYEIFKKSGPLAILPMLKNNNENFNSSVIWSSKRSHLNNLENKNDIMIAAINNEIKKYVGEVTTINDKKIFQLSAHINNSFYSDRLVFVGDSAHTVHPIAGQGWNLGLRDIHNLYLILKEANELGLELGNNLVLKKYNNKCYYDAFFLYQITDKLNYIFSMENVLIKKLRHLGIDFIDNNHKINSLISSYAMGKKLNFLFF